MITNAEKRYLKSFFSFQLAPGNPADPTLGNIWTSHLYNAVVNAISGNQAAAQSFLNQANQFSAQHAQAFSFIPGYRQQLEAVAKEIVRSKKSPDALSRFSCAEGNCPMANFTKPKQQIAEEIKKTQLINKQKAASVPQKIAPPLVKKTDIQPLVKPSESQPPQTKTKAPIAPNKPTTPAPISEPILPTDVAIKPYPYFELFVGFTLLGGLGFGLYKLAKYFFFSRKKEEV